MIKCLKALIRDLRHMWQPNGAWREAEDESLKLSHTQTEEREKEERQKERCCESVFFTYKMR